MSKQNGHNERKAYYGPEGLAQLWKEAMSMYRKAVMESHIMYGVFQNDFINSRKLHDQVESWVASDHLVNLGRIEQLLEQRKDLVMKYCALPLNIKNFEKCMTEFMLIESGKATLYPDFECKLSSSVISILTTAINDIHIFTSDITEMDTELFFNSCSIKEGKRLQATNNQVFSYFFNLLNYSSLISNRYQYVIATRNLVLTSTGKKFISQADMANALSRFQQSEKPIRHKIDNWIPLIKKALLESNDK